MKELVILSGKGGTGKTSLTAAFATLAENHLLCDADVDAADLHLLLQPDIRERYDFSGASKAVIRQEDCTGCGQCREICAFDAIGEDFLVDSISCEGCGVCVDFCPSQAIDFPVQICGEWYFSETRLGPLVHARLGIAEENSGKLVSLLRQEARQRAAVREHDLILIDGPPGIGCPVIASITGATGLLVIVEPTVSGIHDLQRVVKLAKHFQIPLMLCINKAGLHQESEAALREYAKTEGLPLVGTLPFDPVFTKAMVAGKNIMEWDDCSELQQTLRQIWKTIMNYLLSWEVAGRNPSQASVLRTIRPVITGGLPESSCGNC